MSFLYRNLHSCSAAMLLVVVCLIGSTKAANIELSFTVTNDYTETTALSSLHPWSYLAEPHRTSYIKGYINDDLASELDNYDVVWTIGNGTFSGGSINHVFKTVGYHTVTMEVYHNGIKKQETTEDVMVKYVRRELRSLTDDDRNTFLDALQTLYYVSTDDGEEYYGAKYKGMSYFIEKHLYGGAARACDHWHDDAGILTHHTAVSLELEQSLQAIDASISLPYWGYTYDSATLDSGEWATSDIFGDDWFSEASSGRHDRVVASGRWAYTPIPTETDMSDTGITNPYGLLRSPWNLNPYAYLTRESEIMGSKIYTSFPSCKSFATCILSTSMAEVNNCLNGNTHGPVHIMIGGEWGKNTPSVTDFGLASPNLLLIFKNLWRMGYVRCPSSCDAEDSSSYSDCTCYVPDDVLAKYSAYDILDDSLSLHYIEYNASPYLYYDDEAGRYLVSGKTDEESDEIFADLLDTLTNPGWIGEMYTSASPWDPTFWPIHPEAERLVHWKMLASGDSDSFDWSWGYRHDEVTPSDFQKVCDWSAVYSDGDMPNCTAGTCPGHNEDDIMPFFDLIGAGESYTNAEFFSFMSPTNDDLPYMYDNFLWTQCRSEGYNFGESKSLPSGAQETATTTTTSTTASATSSSSSSSNDRKTNPKHDRFNRK